MKNGTRWPPSYWLPFLPRIPALKTLSPEDVPLSVVKMKIVFSVRPSSSRNARSLPTLSSMLAIMPKKFARLTFWSWYGSLYFSGECMGPCGALVAM